MKLVREATPPNLPENPDVTIYELGEDDGDGEGLSAIVAEAWSSGYRPNPFLLLAAGGSLALLHGLAGSKRGDCRYRLDADRGTESPSLAPESRSSMHGDEVETRRFYVAD